MFVTLRISSLKKNKKKKFLSALPPFHSDFIPIAFGAQTRVRGYSDAVFVAKVHECGLLEVQVVFHL